jgi:hypothetical protein
MRVPRNLLLAGIALALVPAAFAKDKHHDRHQDKHAISQSHPAGWDKGKKTGWGDCDVPPGQAKKVGCHPNDTAHHDRDHDRDRHASSHHVGERHDRDAGHRAAEHRTEDHRLAERREADRRAAEKRAAERREAERRVHRTTTTSATTPKPVNSTASNGASVHPQRDRR